MNRPLSYTEAVFVVSPADPGREILTAELAEIGFESFEHTPEGIKAWIQTDIFDKEQVDHIILKYSSIFNLNYGYGEVVPVNWNEEWERNYPPVAIMDRCYVRAPFHESMPDMEFDLVIEPKMSFGTAHHDTTVLMIEWLLELDTEGMRVLDMGCGTGVLAILAAKKGAAEITAVDNFLWACQNTSENAVRNGVGNVKTIHGDAQTLSETGKAFNLILSNINRNVLLEDLNLYEHRLENDGILIMSGFFIDDEFVVNNEAIRCGLIPTGKKHRNQWSSLCYKK